MPLQPLFIFSLCCCRDHHRSAEKHALHGDLTTAHNKLNRTKRNTISKSSQQPLVVLARLARELKHHVIEWFKPSAGTISQSLVTPACTIRLCIDHIEVVCMWRTGLPISAQHVTEQQPLCVLTTISLIGAYLHPSNQVCSPSLV